MHPFPEVRRKLNAFMLASLCLSTSDAGSIFLFRRYPGVEYVMDYILERKRVDDLHQSIKDRRYDKQKYNMQRCGLRHLIYLVEGDPDTLGDETGGHCNAPPHPWLCCHQGMPSSL